MLYRATVSTVDCPGPSRAVLTLLRAEIEWASGRRLPLAEVVAGLVAFAERDREAFVRFCAAGV